MPPEGDAGLIERIAGRGDAAGAVALAGSAAFAWAWLLLNPHAGMAMGPVDPLSAAYLGPAFLMWALMMVAMMLPSAAPMILLYGRVARRGAGSGALPLGLFALAYLGIWALFAAAAALAQAVLIAAGFVSAMTLSLGDARIVGVLLVAAGLYQLSAWKGACLDQCRSPIEFIMRYSRPGPAGALRLGLLHGLYCLGCCWALMLLLFAGGVMNLAWIAGLALLVAAEKLFPPRLRAREIAAGLLIAAGAVLLAGALTT